jgi:hypothetical protein
LASATPNFPRLLRVLVHGIGIVVLAQVLFDAFGPVPPAPNVILGEANARAVLPLDGTDRGGWQGSRRCGGRSLCCLSSTTTSRGDG